MMPFRPAIWLLAGFALAVWLRVLVGGFGVAQSPVAGLVFAACLIGMAYAYGTRPVVSRRAVLAGVLGGLGLCVPAVVVRIWHGSAGPETLQGYAGWVVVVVIVAVAEEYFLRGALFDAVNKWQGEIGAVVAPAVAFAVLHVPLYGWHVLPLDFAVGLALGALRLVAGTWTAPAIAHSLADLLAWWLR